jgi:hypothetical protein
VKTHRTKPTCEQICHPSEKAKRGGCPEDQRCIKDGDQYICHPINDSPVEF